MTDSVGCLMLGIPGTLLLNFVVVVKCIINVGCYFSQLMSVLK